MDNHDTIEMETGWITNRIEEERKVLKARSIVNGICSCPIGADYIDPARMQLIKKDHLGDHEYLQLANDLAASLTRDLLK